MLEEEIATMFKHTSQTPPASPNLPRFTSLLNELLYNEVATKWEQIGVVLGVNAGFLKTTKRKYPGDYRMCFIEMLKEWMKQVNPPPSWSAIISAIENIPGCNSLAQTLRNKYLPEKSDSSQGTKATNMLVSGGPSTSQAHEQESSGIPVSSRGKFIVCYELLITAGYIGCVFLLD